MTDNSEKVTAEAVVVERTFHASADRIWQALTDREKMKQWYFDLAEFKPEVGFTFQFYGGTPEYQYLHVCIITEVIPGKKLSYSWRYDGYVGNSVVSFELFPEGDQTTLKVTHKGLESFPTLADFAKANFVQGWTEIIGESLKQFLEEKNA